MATRGNGYIPSKVIKSTYSLQTLGDGDSIENSNLQKESIHLKSED